MLLNDGGREAVVRVGDKRDLPGSGRTRLARKLFSGRFRPGQSLQIDRIAVEHGMHKESVLKAFAEFQALGMISLVNDFSASVNPPDPKRMQEAYEVRAALEEIAGRTAAATLGGKHAARSVFLHWRTSQFSVICTLGMFFRTWERRFSIAPPWPRPE